MSAEIEGGQILFTQGTWEIHAEFENSEWAEVFHLCQKWDPTQDTVKYSYQIPGDYHCPGCDALQPDEIQGMVAMYNMDKPTRQWGRSLMEQVKHDFAHLERVARLELKNMSLTGDGVNE